MNPSATEKLLGTVLQVNSAVLAAEPEKAILHAVAPLFQTDKAVLFHGDRHKSRATSMHVIGFDPERTRQVLGLNAGSDFMYLASRDQPAGSTHTGSELVRPEVLHSSPLYMMISVPADVEYMVGGILAKDANTYCSVSFWRSAAMGDYDADAKNTLAILLPHLQQALNIANQLRESQRLAARLRTIGLQSLQRARFGILFLDAAGRIVWLNREAARMGRAADGIAISRGRLTLGTHGARQQFEQALRERRGLKAEEPLAGAQSFRVRRRGRGLDYEVLAIPIRNHPHQVMLPREAMMQLFITEPGAMFNVPAAQLVQDFGLTLAEARLCEALVRTGSLSDAASASRIGMNTARSHLKGIFAKLGVSSQLHLLQRLAAHVREPFENIEAE